MSKCFTVLGEFNLSDINVANCFISVNQTRKLSKEATDILRNDVKQMGINNISEPEAPCKKSFSNVCTMHISIYLPIMFSQAVVKNSVHRVGRYPPGRHPSGQTHTHTPGQTPPPRADIPPWADTDTPRQTAPPGQTPPGRHSPETATADIPQADTPGCA